MDRNEQAEFEAAARWYEFDKTWPWEIWGDDWVNVLVYNIKAPAHPDFPIEDSIEVNQVDQEVNREEVNQSMGLKVSDAYPSKYINATDLGGTRVDLTIERISLEEVPSFEEGEDNVNKMCVWFAGKQKGMLLSPTNARFLAQVFGDDSDLWVGKQVALYSVKQKVYGQMKDVLTIDMIKAGTGGAALTF